MLDKLTHICSLGRGMDGMLCIVRYSWRKHINGSSINTQNLFLSGEETSHYIFIHFHAFHFCIYVKYNRYNNQPVRAYTGKSMYSSVISGRSEKSEDIQYKYLKKLKKLKKKINTFCHCHSPSLYIYILKVLTE